MKNIFINEKIIGFNSPIFLIAEAGINHNGELSLAKKLIDIASEADVDAIKFQTFSAEKLILKITPKVQYQKENAGDQESFYEMVKKYELTKEDFKILSTYCNDKGIIFLSTPFDKTSVEWLEELNIPAYKVGSGDMNNFPLLKLICSKKKPILLSTGMATLEEVIESVNFLKSNNVEDIVIFQCTTNYPSNYEEINLNVIDTYKKEFPNNIIGFSDHSLGFEASIGAAAIGVKVIEKHFTINKEMDGPDHKASLNPRELKEWVKHIRNLEKALGDYKKFPSKNEQEIAKIARKSIVTLSDLKEGDTIKKEDIDIKRPGYGISPKYFSSLIGKTIKRNVPKNSILFWEDVE